MQPERVRLHYSDGSTEWRQPPTVPEIGTVLTRGGKRWIVATIEQDDDLATIVLRPSNKSDTRALIEPRGTG